MKAIILIIASIVFLIAGTANAYYSGASLYLGSNYSSNIYITEGGTPETTTGGPVGPSTLGGVSLEYVYCVDLYRVVYVPVTYPDTAVTNNGVIYGNSAPVNNAAQIAWLLSTYGVWANNQGSEAQAALQAAIWHEEYNGNVSLNQKYAPSAQYSYYSTYLTSLGSNTGNVGNFLWMTPTDSSGIEYQAQVGVEDGIGTYGSSGGSVTPIPSSVFLLGFGLASLIVIKIKRVHYIPQTEITMAPITIRHAPINL